MDFGKILLKIGLVLCFIGLIAMGLKKIGINIGKLPGDINIQREGFSFSFPIVTCILVSIVLTIIMQLFFRGK